MTIIQLNPQIPLVVLGKGEGYAVAMIDYSPEYSIYWVCFITATRECWTVPNEQIRACKNITLGRTLDNKASEANN
jgi:hypothetical protein